MYECKVSNISSNNLRIKKNINLNTVKQHIKIITVATSKSQHHSSTNTARLRSVEHVHAFHRQFNLHGGQLAGHSGQQAGSSARESHHVGTSTA